MGIYADNAIVEKIRGSIDIVQYISSYVNIKKKGKNYQGLCPFHSERTPSFSVDPQRQLYYCFGCGAGGDVFSFVMKIENLSFGEVIAKLAEETGNTFEESGLTSDELQKLREKKKMLEINEITVNFYNHNLATEAGERGKKYFVDRGLNNATIQKFQLGYALASWDSLHQQLVKNGINSDLADRAGVVCKRNTGTGFYDRFRERVIFPIFDSLGKVIGFGGRVLDDTLPKYINSPETDLFVKSKNLYGLNFARDKIAKDGYVIIVEGYMDVISLHQSGIENVVAPLGTSLTREQLRALKRYCKEVVLLYDNDKAGMIATRRATELCLEEEIKVRIASFPGSKDPDEFVKNHGVEAMLLKISDAPLFFDHYLKKSLADNDTRTLTGKMEVINSLASLLGRVKSRVEYEEMVKKLAGEINVSVDAVSSEIRKEYKFAKRADGYQNSKFKQTTIAVPNIMIDPVSEQLPEGWDLLTKDEKDGYFRAEKQLVHLIIKNIELFSNLKESLDLSFFIFPENKKIIDRIIEVYQVNDSNHHRIISALEEDGLNNRIIEALMKDEGIKEPEKIISDCIQKMKQYKQTIELRLLQQKIHEFERSGDFQKTAELMLAYQQKLKE